MWLLDINLGSNLWNEIVFWKNKTEWRVNFEVSKSVFNFTQALMAARFKQLSRIFLQKNSKSIMEICVANYCQKLALIFLHSPFISVNTAELFAKTDISHFSCAMTMRQMLNHQMTIWQKLKVYTSSASVCVRVGQSCSLLQRHVIFLLQVDKDVIPLQSKSPWSHLTTHLSKHKCTP
jgi:hypothetical protein